MALLQHQANLVEEQLKARDNVDIKHNFQGKNVMMTGASSGIGRAIAKKLLRSGANVIMLGRNVSAMQSLNTDIKKVGQSFIYTCDLLKPIEMEETFLRVIENFEGKIDCLINAAGVVFSKEYLECTLPEYDQVMTINVRAPMQLMSMAIPWLKETRGNIVNISAAPVPRPRQTVWCMTKSCLDMMTKCSALELASFGVRVNSVGPGVTDTPIRMQSTYEPLGPEANKDFLEHAEEDVPLGYRVTSANQVANAALFLASDKAAFITGQTMIVDGGSHLATQGCWKNWDAYEEEQDQQQQLQMVSRKPQPTPAIREPTRVKVLMIGDSRVGKSSIVQALIGNRMAKTYEQTIGVDTLGLKAGNFALTFWDLGGAQQWIEVRNEFYKEAQMLLLVFDVSMKQTFDGLDMWIREASNNGGSRCPLLLVGNKLDQANRRAVAKEEANQWASSRQFKYLETSAQSGEGIEALRNALTGMN